MEDDDSIANPHDRFIRHFLGEVEQVRELIAWQLPAEVIDELDLTSIEPTKQTFVNRLLREQLSDLVFQIRLSSGQQGLVVLLFEHKSNPDEMTPFQVLRYIVEICFERVRNGQPLCCVIPIVLYHGERPWTVARTVDQLVDVPDALKRYVPQFTLPLIDLSQRSDDELRGESLFLVTMQLLKYIKREDFPSQLPQILSLYRKLLSPASALEGLEAVLRYIISGTDRIEREELNEIASQVLHAQGESFMPTIAEQLLQEGREQGELIGEIRAIQRVLGQAPSERESLAKMSLDELRRMSDELTKAVDDRAK